MPQGAWIRHMSPSLCKAARISYGDHILRTLFNAGLFQKPHLWAHRSGYASPCLIPYDAGRVSTRETLGDTETCSSQGWDYPHQCEEQDAKIVIEGTMKLWIAEKYKSQMSGLLRFISHMTSKSANCNRVHLFHRAWCWKLAGCMLKPVTRLIEL